MNLDWTELMAADVEVLPKYRKRVQDRDAKQLCLGSVVQPDGTEKPCDATAIKRGLCANCHYRFRMERLGTPASKRRLYENNRIRMGTLMPDRQGKWIRRKPAKKAG